MPRTNAPATRQGSADPAELATFAKLAGQWWDPDGPFGKLHDMNPVRIGVVRRHALDRFARDGEAARPFEGLSALDVGCGGGIATEPLHRLGFSVTGVDAETRNVGIARAHAATVGLDIPYRQGTAEGLLAEGWHADLVVCLEVVEHVTDPTAFLADLAALVRPGGLLVLSTLNRTLRSLALAKIAAEYVLGWVEPGTHDWRKFLKPSEVARPLRQAGLVIDDIPGLVLDPAAGGWRESRDVAINYMVVAHRPART